MYTDRKVIHYQDSVGSRRNCILFKPHRLTDKEVSVQLVVCVSVGRHFAFVCNINGIRNLQGYFKYITDKWMIDEFQLYEISTVTNKVGNHMNTEQIKVKLSFTRIKVKLSFTRIKVKLSFTHYLWCKHRVLRHIGRCQGTELGYFPSVGIRCHILSQPTFLREFHDDNFLKASLMTVHFTPTFWLS